MVASGVILLDGAATPWELEGDHSTLKPTNALSATALTRNRCPPRTPRARPIVKSEQGGWSRRRPLRTRQLRSGTTMRRAFRTVAILVLAVASGCTLPLAAERQTGAWSLDASRDGKYLLVQDQEGITQVFSLEKRARFPHPPSGRAPRTVGSITREGPIGLAFLGLSNDVVVACGEASVCIAPVSDLGDSQPLFSVGDPDDFAAAAIGSADGQRVVVGTKLGRVITFDRRTAMVSARKPKDIWGFLADPVYLLEGDDHLEMFVSATSSAVNVTADKRDQVVDHPDLGYQEWFGHDRSTPPRLLPLWRWPVVWRFDGGLPEGFNADFGWRVQGGLSPDGSLIALCDSSNPFVLSRVAEPHKSWEERGRFCRAVRFVDPEGATVLALDGDREVAYFGRLAPTGLSVLWGTGAVTRLKHKASPGRRVLISLPDRRWIFVGLEQGGADWYEYVPGSVPKLKFIASLRN